MPMSTKPNIVAGQKTVMTHLDFSTREHNDGKCGTDYDEASAYYRWIYGAGLRSQFVACFSKSCSLPVGGKFTQGLTAENYRYS